MKDYFNTDENILEEEFDFYVDTPKELFWENKEIDIPFSDDDIDY